MEEHVSNPSNTLGFVNLEGGDVEHVTTVSSELLEDAVDIAKALETKSWYKAKICLVHREGVENPALAITTEDSEPKAVALAAMKDSGEVNSE